MSTNSAASLTPDGAMLGEMRPQLRDQHALLLTDVLEDSSKTLASPDAHGFQPVSNITPPHFTKKCGENPATCGTDRVAE